MSNEQQLRDKIAELEKRIEALRAGLPCSGVLPKSKGVRQFRCFTPERGISDAPNLWCPNCRTLAADDAASLRTGEQVKE